MRLYLCACMFCSVCSSCIFSPSAPDRLSLLFRLPSTGLRFFFFSPSRAQCMHDFAPLLSSLKQCEQGRGHAHRKEGRRSLMHMSPCPRGHAFEGPHIQHEVDRSKKAEQFRYGHAYVWLYSCTGGRRCSQSPQHAKKCSQTKSATTSHISTHSRIQPNLVLWGGGRCCRCVQRLQTRLGVLLRYCIGRVGQPSRSRTDRSRVNCFFLLHDRALRDVHGWHSASVPVSCMCCQTDHGPSHCMPLCMVLKSLEIIFESGCCVTFFFFFHCTFRHGQRALQKVIEMS